MYTTWNLVIMYNVISQQTKTVDEVEMVVETQKSPTNRWEGGSGLIVYYNHSLWTIDQIASCNVNVLQFPIVSSDHTKHQSPPVHHVSGLGLITFFIKCYSLQIIFFFQDWICVALCLTLSTMSHQKTESVFLPIMWSKWQMTHRDYNHFYPPLGPFKYVAWCRCYLI